MPHQKFPSLGFSSTAGGGGRRGLRKRKVMFKKLSLFLVIVLVLVSPIYSADLSLEDIIGKIQSNQSRIKDMYAETTTKITSNFQLTTDNKSKTQTMVQKGKMWTKGSDKSKIEMLSPIKQITITSGDQMAIINPDTGQKMIQDLKKLKGQVPGGKGQGEMDLAKAMEYFNLSVAKKDEDYIITGVPKEANKFLGKMEFYVDSEKWVPVKILMYGPKDKLMSQSVIEYQEVSGVWVPVKNVSNVNTPAGAMKVEMEFNNVKVNKGISDREFAID